MEKVSERAEGGNHAELGRSRSMDGVLVADCFWSFRPGGDEVDFGF